MNSRSRLKPSAPGRYDLRGALPASDAFPLPRSRRRVSVATIGVPVPRPFEGSDRGARQQASVNVRTDILETELHQGRISEAAFAEGRRVQQLLEVSQRIGGTNWTGGDRVDMWIAHEARILDAIVDAQDVQREVAWLRHELGAYDTQILRWALGDGMSYMSMAARTGPATTRRASVIAARFRTALESLANARAAVGANKPRTNYDDVAPHDV